MSADVFIDTNGALEADCRTLYSEDLQHGQQIDGLTIADPFRASGS